jgi:hypothetical protein
VDPTKFLDQLAALLHAQDVKLVLHLQFQILLEEIATDQDQHAHAHNSIQQMAIHALNVQITRLQLTIIRDVHQPHAQLILIEFLIQSLVQDKPVMLARDVHLELDQMLLREDVKELSQHVHALRNIHLKDLIVFNAQEITSLILETTRTASQLLVLEIPF